MARSMTGFGRGSASSEGLSITVEVKTVNHKHLNIYINGARNYPELEACLRGLLTQAFDRGSVQANVTIERSGALRPVVVPDTALIAGYAEVLSRLEADLKEPPSPKLALIASLPGAFTVREPDLEEGLMERLVTGATTSAVAAVNELRSREGKTLSDELRGRVETLRQLANQIGPLGTESLLRHRARVAERVRDLLAASGGSVPEDRLELEIALLADKCDVSEEIERLRSHLDQFDWLLNREDPVGRRLDFLCQEIGRESNTVGSKSQDARLSQLVVELRSENERIREQVQNLE